MPKAFIGVIVLMQFGAVVSYALKRQYVECLFWGALALANIATTMR